MPTSPQQANPFGGQGHLAWARLEAGDSQGDEGQLRRGALPFKGTCCGAKSGVYPEVLDAITSYRQQAPGNIFLIPIRLSDCEIPDIEIDDTRTLDRLQSTDLFPATKRTAGLQKLLAALKALPRHP